ncbi:heterokaryon incompatibility protein-domain-containing protein, partial [Podospora aff. communis PSN243]
MAPDPPSKTPRFAHQPLDESEDCIRLIEISPITPKSLEIQCIIKHVRLSERPQYEALSYMWGDSSKTMDILIDGKVFGVTVNLRDGLWYLRQRANGSSMKFWVDAICINQGDMNEKIRQIRIMRQIYSQAQTVVAWLGGRWTLPIRRREDKSLCAFNESLAGKVEVVVDGSVNTSYRLKIEKWTPLKIRWLKSKSPGSVIPRDYLHLPEGFPKKRPTRPDGLYHDKYWERVWIVQELGNAAKVEVAYISRNVLQPGNEWRLCACTFSWEEFLKTIWDDRTEGPIRLDRQLREKPEGGFALSDLLLAHVGAKCQLTHDKVYGLLGLAVDSEGFPIDYEKSLFEVWKDTVRFINPTDHESTVRLAARCWRVLGDSHVEESAAELSRSIETPAAPTEQTDGT